MFAKTRIIATVLVFVFMILTLIAGLALKKGGLAILFCILQFLAMTWYSISYIPFARDAIKKCAGTCLDVWNRLLLILSFSIVFEDGIDALKAFCIFWNLWRLVNFYAFFNWAKFCCLTFCICRWPFLSPSVVRVRNAVRCERYMPSKASHPRPLYCLWSAVLNSSVWSVLWKRISAFSSWLTYPWSYNDKCLYFF